MPKNFPRLTRLPRLSGPRIKPYGIVTKRNKTYHIVFPNQRDRDQSLTILTPRSVKMCCDLLRSVALCRIVLLTISRLIREQIRVDTIRCDRYESWRFSTHEAKLLRSPAFRCIPNTIYVRFEIKSLICTRRLPTFTQKCILQ